MHTDVQAVQDGQRSHSDAEDALVTQLFHRYQQGTYYTQLQESVLVAVNAYGSRVDVGGDDILQMYKRAYRNTRAGASVRNLPPHIFGLALNAYFYMQRTGQDQSIFFSCVV